MRRRFQGGTVTLKGLTWSDGKAARYYYLRANGRKVALGKGPIDSPDFLRRYAEAMEQAPPPRTRAKEGSIAAVCAAFRASTTFSGYSSSYKSIMHRHMAAICKTQARADAPISGLRPPHINTDISALDPHPARHRLKVWRQVCGFALSRGWTETNAAISVKPPRPPKTDGHLVWRAEDIAAFRNTWPIGSVQRLCFEVVYWSAARTVDAVRLSVSMIDAQGVLTFKQQKTGGPAHVPWTCALPDWADSMASDQAMMHECIQRGVFTFLEVQAGRSRSKKGLSNLISHAARVAGIEGRSAHGLRKSRLTSIAATGGSVHAIMAWGGHVTLSEAQRYITSLDRKSVILGTERVRNIANTPILTANTEG